MLVAGPQDQDSVQQFIAAWLDQVPERATALILGWPADELRALPALQAAPAALSLPGANTPSATRLFATAKPHFLTWEQPGRLVDGEALELSIQQPVEAGLLMAELLLTHLTDPVVVVLCHSMRSRTSALDFGIVDSSSLVVLEAAPEERPERESARARYVPGGQLYAVAVEHARRLQGQQESGRSQPTYAQLEQITGIVAQATTVDFSEYKPPTLLRRIQRRMAVNGLDSVSDYITRLEESHQEINLLQQEMLIGVTRFFRDPDAFEAIRARVVPGLVERASQKTPIRVWVAGCSTGEEVYSLAMMLADSLEQAGKRLDLRIFATDLDKEALSVASAGIYERDALDRIRPDWIERYFVPHGQQVQVASVLRDLVIFAPHNMIRDAPFHRLDLISCRNVLIYLRPEVQQRLLGTFHFALQPRGHLLLGHSEQVGEAGALLHPVDPLQKIYRKHPGRSSMGTGHGPVGIQSWRLAQLEPAARITRTRDPESLVEAIRQSLLHEFIINFIVVDDVFEIHHLYGDHSRYLTLPQGRPSLNLIKLVPAEMGIALSTGIRKSLSTNETVVFERVAVQRGSTFEARVTIRPFLHRHDFGRLAVVVIEPTDSSEAVAGVPFDVAAQSSQRIYDLELELETTGHNLRAALEELETSNEEMQATNEELLAANEELQSSNEELQSVNEELHTVNVECKAKIAELTSDNEDIINSLVSSNIGTIFLDPQLCVWKFTAPATRQVNLIESDIGRPFEHLTNNIGRPGLVDDARRVLASRQPLQCEVHALDGRWYAMRIALYQTRGHEIDGVVITFVDSGLFLPALWGGTDGRAGPNTILLACDAAWGIEYANAQFQSITGWSAGDPAGAGAVLAGDEPSRTAFDAACVWVATGQPWCGRLGLRRHDGGIVGMAVQIMPVFDGQGRLQQILTVGTIPSASA